MTLTFDPNPCPSFPLKMTPTERLSTNDFGDGYSQSVPDGINFQLEQYDLVWENLTAEEADTIMDFFAACNGPQIPFLWENPRGITKAFKVTKRDRSYDQANGNTITATFNEDPNGGI